MLNNITNFFNLIKTGKVKTQLDGTDLLPIGTRDNRFTGQYQPTMIKYSDLVAGLVGGSNGQVLFNDNDTIAGASNLYWDKLNERVGIGTSTPSTTFAIGSGGINRVNLGLQAFEMYTASSVRTVFLGYSSTSGQLILSSAGSNDVVFTAGSFKSISTGNLGLGTTTDSGFRLDINGTARVQGSLSLTAGNVINIGNVQALAPNTGNDLMVGFNNSLLTLYTSNNPVGRFFSTGNFAIGTTTDAGFRLDVNGTARVVGPTFAVGDWTNRSTSVYVRALTGGSENRGFFIGTGASNDGNVGSFTYQPTGNLLNIRSPYNSGTVALSFEGNTNSTQFHNTSGTAVSKFFSNTGNWGINTTTDAGYKLDVNGDTRSTNFRLTDNTLIASAYTVGGTTLNVSNIGHYGAIGINVSSATGLRASSTVGLDPSGPTQASIYAAGGATGGRISLGLLSNRALITSVASGTAMHNSSMLQVDSTTQGFLPPRMTSAERTAILTPAVGLMVYQTDATEGLYIYKSTGWALNS